MSVKFKSDRSVPSICLTTLICKEVWFSLFLIYAYIYKFWILSLFAYKFSNYHLLKKFFKGFSDDFNKTFVLMNFWWLGLFMWLSNDQISLTFFMILKNSYSLIFMSPSVSAALIMFVIASSSRLKKHSLTIVLTLRKSKVPDPSSSKCWNTFFICFFRF